MSTTSFDLFYSRFFDKVENDIDFFDYYNHSDEESMELAKQRASNYLMEAVDILNLKCTATVNWLDIDEMNQCFNFEAVPTEIEIISRIMFTIYLERDLAKLKPVLNSLTSTDIKLLYSPANERRSFNEMLNEYRHKTEVLISNYAARDRITGKRKLIPYES